MRFVSCSFLKLFSMMTRMGGVFSKVNKCRLQSRIKQKYKYPDCTTIERLQVGSWFLVLGSWFLVRTLDERRRAAGTYSDSGMGCNLEARELAFVKRVGSPRWKRIHALDVGLGLVPTSSQRPVARQS
ncbi:hypothetical protein V2G26_006073 [Clonostachys chloroleuca]